MTTQFQLHPAYRPDIDGLRAIAVLSVVLYHAFPGKLAGGFIGVDIFFVISGFLISTIIYSNLDRNSFSLADFYSRRVRRIFPALIVIMVASLAFGWAYLLPIEYAQLGKHVAGGATFISNFILWMETGYFDNAAESKPMLHLWSLAIEEQFYVIWPLLLHTVWKKKWNFLTATLTFAALSFFASLALTRYDATSAFYFPLSRFWELMAGGVLAYLGLHNRIPLARSPNAKSATGLILILTALLLVDKTRDFPGWWALLPTAGAFLLISSGPNAFVNKHLLRNPALVSIGLISYPLYLWHWPVLTFLKILAGDPSRTSRIVAVIASFLLAYLTYRFIERPIRAARLLRPISIAARPASLVMAMAMLLGTGSFILTENGLRGRTLPAHMELAKRNASELTWASDRSPDCETILGVPSAFCITFGNTARIRTAVIGDSTANSLAPGLAHYYANEKNGLINIGSWTCPPIRGISSSIPGTVTQEYDCAEITRRTYEYILTSKDIQLVFLSIFSRDLNSWTLPGISANAPIAEKFEKLKPMLDRDLSALTEKGIRIVVTYDTPRLPIPASACLDRLPDFFKGVRCEVLESQLIDRHPQVDLFAQFLGNRSNICVFRQSDLMIHDGRVRYFDDNGLLLVRDGIHLSYNGSRQMAEAYTKSECFIPLPPSADSPRVSLERRYRPSTDA